jgi:hypothetical protein
MSGRGGLFGRLCENAKIMYGRMKDSTDRTSGVSESIPVGTREGEKTEAVMS